MIERKIATMPLVKGLDTSTDPKVMQEGLLVAENATFGKRAEIKKRHGLSHLSGPSSSTDPYAESHMAAYREQPVLFEKSLRVKSGSTFERLDELDLLDIDVAMLETEKSIPYGHVAIRGSIRLVVYQDDSALWAKTTDRQSHALRDSVHLGVATDAGGRCIWDGSTLRIIYAYGGAIAYRTVDIETGGIGSPSPIIGTSSVSPDVPMDVCFLGDRDRTVMVIYATSTFDIEVLMLTGSDRVTRRTYSQKAAKAVGCFRLRTGVGIAVYYEQETHAVKFRGLDVRGESIIFKVVGEQVFFEVTAWTGSTAQSCPSVTGCRIDDTTGRLYLTINTSGLLSHQHQFEVQACDIYEYQGDASVGRWLFKMGLALSSKPLLATSDHYIVGFLPHVDRSQRCFFVLRSDGLVVGKYLMGYAQGDPLFLSRPQQGSGAWIFASPHRSTIDRSGLALIRVTTDVGQVSAIEGPSTLVIPNSLPWEFDGKRVTEAGHLMFPWDIDVKSGGSGSLSESVTYGVQVVYERMDEQGNVIQSCPSPLKQYFVGTSGVRLAITVPTLTLGKDVDKVRIVEYRTLGNGQLLYRVQPVENDPSQRSITFEDFYADDHIATNPVLESSRGFIETIQPQPFRVGCLHQRRLFYVPREAETTQVHYTKEFLPKTGIGYTDYLTIRVDPTDGRITALLSYLDRILIGKPHRILACHGRGLDAMGKGADYSPPYVMSEAIGIAHQKTVVQTPLGPMFLASNQRIYLLDRTFRVQPIGEPVAFHTQTSEVKSAHLLADHDSAIWLTSDGSALVYNYRHGMWSTWTNHQATDAAVCGGLLYHRALDGTVRVEDRSTYRDAGSSVSLKIRTGWIAFGEQGQHLRLFNIFPIGQALSPHRLRTKIAYNYDLVFDAPDNRTWDATKLGQYQDSSVHYGPGQSAAYRDRAYLLKLYPSRTRCTSFLLELSDEDIDSPMEQGFSLTAIAFLYGQEKGLWEGGVNRRA